MTQRQRWCLATLVTLAASLAVAAADPVPDTESPDEIPAPDMPAQPDAPPPIPVLPIDTAAPPPEALVLDGNFRRETIDCAGRDVLIHGDGGDYRLINGCRTVSVQGRDDRIDAELQPGARLVIGGPDVTLRYVLIAPGAPPILSVTSASSQAIPVDRIDPTASPQQPRR
jgi:hypothetical protein